MIVAMSMLGIISPTGLGSSGTPLNLWLARAPRADAYVSYLPAATFWARRMASLSPLHENSMTSLRLRGEGAQASVSTSETPWCDGGWMGEGNSEAEEVRLTWGDLERGESSGHSKAAVAEKNSLLILSARDKDGEAARNGSLGEEE